MRMLDLFCGRFGWGRAFAARGWEVIGVDLVEPPEIPQGCRFVRANILDVFYDGHHSAEAFCVNGEAFQPDFICASSPCEEFSVHGMRHFHPNPPYPELGIKLFNYTRGLCGASERPYVMENVRAAQQFVGNAVSHCGPFYLWGTGVPPILPQGIQKGISHGGDSFKNLTIEERRLRRKLYPHLMGSSRSEQRKAVTAAAATIPPELAGAVADYATRLCEVTA